jgi:hypothetical protein
VERAEIIENIVYARRFANMVLQAGYRGDNKDILIKDNYLVGGWPGKVTGVLFVRAFEKAVVTGNTLVATGVLADNYRGSVPQTGTWDNNKYYGGMYNAAAPFHFSDQTSGFNQNVTFADWQKKTGSDKNTSYQLPEPGVNKIFVRPNKYELGRANIAIYNWEHKNSADVNVSGVLPIGTAYEVRDVQAYSAGPIVSGTYNGGAITIPLTARPIDQPLGAVTHMENMVHTLPNFGVFVLLPVASTPGVAAPAISPNGGSFTGQVTVSISAQPGATIRYTTNGAAPTASSTAYTAPFSLSASAVVKAIAVSGAKTSPVASASFTIQNGPAPPATPNISPNGGVFTAPVTVSMSAALGCTIRYTTNGAPPTSSSPVYAAPFSLSASATVKAIAISGAQTSPVASSSFTIQPQPTSNDTKAPKILSITTPSITTSAATIAWTTDEPSDSLVRYRKVGTSTLLSSPLNSSRTTSHSVALSGLTSKTTYEYYIRTTDAAGNMAVSARRTFVTK